MERAFDEGMFEPIKVTIEMEDYLFFINMHKLCLTVLQKSNGVEKCFPLNLVMTDRIQKAFVDKKIYLSLSETCKFPSSPLYASARNILTRVTPDGTEFYTDLILYNGKNVLPSPVLNRSLGHANDVHELEVFQVLLGEIVSIFINPDDPSVRYVGVFGERSFYAVPPGWFHCTYVSMGPAAVANFYCHAFWKTDISKKPYFTGYNPVSFEMTETGPVFQDGGRHFNNTAIADCSLGKIRTGKNSPWLPYTNLYATNGYFKELDAEKDIFSLLHSNKITLWMKGA